MNLLGLLNRSVAPDAAEKRRIRKAAAEKAAYPAGYCKPPEDRRFRKGQSGNPRGRPRKVEAVGEVLTPLPKMSAQEMLIAEAYRMVRVRDGKRRIEMPAIQAAFRELSMAAARGDRLALSCMAQMVFRLEAQRPAPAEAAVPDAATEAPMDNFDGEEWWYDEDAETWCYRPTPEEPASWPPLSPEVATALDYKTAWTKALKLAASERVDLAPPVPHPDEIMIDRERGTLAFAQGAPDQPLSLDGLRALVAGMRADADLRREISNRESWVAYSPEDIARCRLSGLVGRLECDLEAYLAGEAPGADVVAPTYQITVENVVIDTPKAAARPGECVGNQGAGPAAEMPFSEVSALDPEAAERVAEAEAYKRIWIAGLAEAARLGVPLEPPVPHPDAVQIDPVAGTVTYRVPIGDGEGATLDQAYAGIQQARALETGLRRDLCFTDYRDMPEAERRHAAAKEVADAMSAANGAGRGAAAFAFRDREKA